MRSIRRILIGAAALSMLAGAAGAAETISPPMESWSWTGPLGSFDRASAQRGLQIYRESCAACHGLRQLHYRNLAELGYSEAAIKAFAAEFEVQDGPDADGEMFMRPAKPSDRFVSPFPNAEAAAAANGGAVPPDLSLIIKSRARGHGNIGVNFLRWMSGRDTASGADYVYHLLTGYLEAEDASQWLADRGGESSFELPEGKYFNKWFPGHAISMAPPIMEGLVEYQDGTPADMQQMARDVTTFLAWAAEPELEQRKRMGLATIGFLFVLFVIAVLAKRRLWADVEH